VNFGPVESIIFLAIVVLWLAGQWCVFAKAGHPGWAAIVPIYNYYVWIKIAGHSGWWLLLYLIPLVGTVAHLIISIHAAKAFGENGVFGFGMWLIPVAFVPILGFGSATYVGAGLPAHDAA
jgi:hypothetical protein